MWFLRPNPLDEEWIMAPAAGGVADSAISGHRASKMHPSSHGFSPCFNLRVAHLRFGTCHAKRPCSPVWLSSRAESRDLGLVPKAGHRDCAQIFRLRRYAPTLNMTPRVHRIADAPSQRGGEPERDCRAAHLCRLLGIHEAGAAPQGCVKKAAHRRRFALPPPPFLGNGRAIPTLQEVGTCRAGLF